MKFLSALKQDFDHGFCTKKKFEPNTFNKKYCECKKVCTRLAYSPSLNFCMLLGWLASRRWRNHRSTFRSDQSTSLARPTSILEEGCRFLANAWREKEKESEGSVQSNGACAITS